MNEISNIHAFEDEDFLHACFVWGMVVVGVFAVCLVPVFMLLGGPADLDAADAGGWTAVLGWIVGLAAVSAASFAVHELVHGVFFKLLAPAGAQVTFGANRETAMIYACAEGVVYSRRRYMAVCLAPTVVVTAAFALGVCVLGLSAVVLPGGRLAFVGLCGRLVLRADHPTRPSHCRLRGYILWRPLFRKVVFWDDFSGTGIKKSLVRNDFLIPVPEKSLRVRRC